MKNTSRTMLFTLSLILFLCHAASSAKLYESVCNEAGADSARCLQLLKSEPKVASAKDYVQLSKVILQMAAKKGKEGQKYLKELVSTNPSSAAIKQCATTHYDLVVGSFLSSLGELTEDTLTANYDAKVAGDGPTTCDRALAAENIKNPSIAALNNDVLLLSKIAFLATNKLPSD